jgi:DNA (cytosine-5)-methyltransferase 1
LDLTKTKVCRSCGGRLAQCLPIVIRVAAQGHVSTEHLHETIHSAISGTRTWVLLGGPPCQAYSVIGRSRMTGIGSAARNNAPAEKLIDLRDQRAKNFAADHRHTLYREYLRVVAVHQPSVFVMENVKGILSARIHQNRGGVESSENLIFELRRQDLADPWEALLSDPDQKMLDRLRREFGNARHAYRLHSFVAEPVDLFGELANSDFVVRSERYGVRGNERGPSFVAQASGGLQLDFYLARSGYGASVPSNGR